jgi:ferredoxin
VHMIHVDRERCMGSGVCVFNAPATFSQDDDTKSVVIDPSGDTEDVIRRAVAACPTSALSLSFEEDESW